MRRRWPMAISRTHGSPAGMTSRWSARVGSSLLSTRGVTELFSATDSLIMVSSSEEVTLSQSEAAAIFRPRDAAGIVNAGRCDCANCQLHGFGLVLRIGVQWMLAGVEDGQHIHLRTQLDVISCFGVVRAKTDSPLGIDVDAAEEVEIGHQVARSETPLRQFDQETVAAISMTPVAHFLVGGKTVFLLDQLPIGGSADRVVPAHRIGDNREKNSAHVRIQNKTLRQPREVLRLECVGQVVTFDRAGEVVEDRSDVGATFGVGDRNAVPRLST